MPIAPIGGGAAKGPAMLGPPIPGIGGAGSARGSNCAYMFCKQKKKKHVALQVNIVYEITITSQKY